MAYDAIYRATIYASRSVDPTETTPLAPAPGALPTLNWLLWSEAWATSPWLTAGSAGATTANGAGTAPDGTLTATSVVPTLTSGTHNAVQNVTVTANENLAASCFLHSLGNYTGAILQLSNTGGPTVGVRVYVDLSTGASSSAAFGTGSKLGGARVVPLAGGWYWVSLWGSVGNGLSSVALTVYSFDSYADAIGFTAFAGDGTSGLLGWGAQLERNGVSSIAPAPLFNNYQRTTSAAGGGAFRVATSENVVGFKPYMGMPTGRRGRLDVLSKKTDTGTLSFDILDMRVTPGGSNAVRWVTAFTGGTNQLAYLARLKCYVEESLDGGTTWSAFWTGRVTLHQLKSGSRIWISVTVSDMSIDLTNNIFTGLPHQSVYQDGGGGITSCSAANPTVVTTAAAHGRTGTFFVRITNTSDTTLWGYWQATVVDSTHFSIPVSSAGSTGGSWYGGYSQLVSVAPVGIIYPYGSAALTPPLTGTIMSVDSVNGWAALTLDAASQKRMENRITMTLVQATNPDAMILPVLSFLSPASTAPPYFSGSCYAQLTRTDTGASGFFLVGFTATSYQAGLSLMNGTISTGPVQVPIAGIVIKPLALPVGVATGTPQANGATSANPTALTQSVPTKGWTPSITGILGQGDIISFAGHAQRYVVTTAVNSDVSGNATVTVSPGLQANVASSEAISVQSQPGYMALPPASTPVSLNVVADMRIADGGSKDNDGNYQPGNLLLINEVHPAQVLLDVCNGYFGRIYRPTAGNDGVPTVALPPGKNVGDSAFTVAVNAGAFATLVADRTFPPFRCVIDKMMPVRDFIEQYVCKPYGIGYYFDPQGRLTPVDMRQPTSTGGMVSLTDADLVDEKVPTWAYDPTQGYSQAKVTIYAEAIVQPIAARLQEGDAFPTITTKMMAESAGDIVDLAFGNPDLGTRQYAFDCKGYRAQPNEISAFYGAPTTGYSRWGQVRDAALAMCRAIGSRPYGNGVITTTLVCQRTSGPTSLYPGSFFIGTFSTLPATDTNQRGTARLFCCTERSEDGPRIKITAIDWGVSVVSTAPTLGTPTTLTGDTFHSCQCLVTPNATGEAVDVWINVTPSTTAARPADSDPGWRFLSRVWVPTTVLARQLPSGSKIWWRARSMPAVRGNTAGGQIAVPVLKIPSAWAYAGNGVTLSALSAPTALALVGSAAATAFTISWSNPDSSLFVEIWMATPVTDPRAFVVRLPPGSTRYTVQGTLAATAYRVGVRATDSVGGYAETTLDVTTAASDPVAPTPRACSTLLTTVS